MRDVISAHDAIASEPYLYRPPFPSSFLTHTNPTHHHYHHYHYHRLHIHA